MRSWQSHLFLLACLLGSAFCVEEGGAAAASAASGGGAAASAASSSSPTQVTYVFNHDPDVSPPPSPHPPPPHFDLADEWRIALLFVVGMLICAPTIVIVVRRYCVCQIEREVIAVA